MRAKPLELHPEAEEDYLNALDWYRKQSFRAAVNFEDAFWRAVQAVEEAPERCKVPAA